MPRRRLGRKIGEKSGLGAPWWNKADPERVLSAYFDGLSAEQLWAKVYNFDRDSHLALSALGRRFYDDSAARIRNHLADDFRKHADARKSELSDSDRLSRSTSFEFLLRDPDASIELARQRVSSAALKILADHPQQEDRPVFLRCLCADVNTLESAIACLRGLAAAGQGEDLAKISVLLSHSNPSVHAAAVRAYLALSPSCEDGVKDLLSEPSEYRVWTIIDHALCCDRCTLWPLLRPFLAHDNEDIRRLICHYGVQSLRRSGLRRLLRDYLGRDRFFYNVVVLLDRALYAPKLLRDAYARDEAEFFEKWRATATWQWEEN